MYEALGSVDGEIVNDVHISLTVVVMKVGKLDKRIHVISTDSSSSRAPQLSART